MWGDAITLVPGILDRVGGNPVRLFRLCSELGPRLGSTASFLSIVSYLCTLQTTSVGGGNRTFVYF